MMSQVGWVTAQQDAPNPTYLTYQLFGSYVFNIPGSKFLPDYPKMEVEEAINQEARKRIECIKHPILCHIPW